MGLYLTLQTICNKGLKTFSLLTGIESSIAKMYILICIFFVEIAVILKIFSMFLVPKYTCPNFFCAKNVCFNPCLKLFWQQNVSVVTASLKSILVRKLHMFKPLLLIFLGAQNANI